MKRKLASFSWLKNTVVSLLPPASIGENCSGSFKFHILEGFLL